MGGVNIKCPKKTFIGEDVIFDTNYPEAVSYTHLIDMGNYYRIPCDNRDLNYDKFFSEGDEVVSRIEDYHSHNTQRLDVEGRCV